MIVDFHTHAFPAQLAQRAVSALSEKSGGLPPHTDGTVDGLRTSMQRQGVSKSVLLHIATNPRQQSNVNNFAMKSNAEDVICFGSVHPDAPDALEELERIQEGGLLGVKLHPDYQDFYVDEERLFPLYRKIASLGLITVFHSGVDIGFPDDVHNIPQRLVKALPHFGGSAVVLAHMGGWKMWEEVERHLLGRDIYLDTSFCKGLLSADAAKRMIDKQGVDRILFGSDTPWGDLEEELGFVEELGLSEEEKAQVLGGNALRLLGF